VTPSTDIFLGRNINEFKTASGAKYVLAAGTRDYNNSNTSALYLSTDGGATWPNASNSFFNSVVSTTVTQGTLDDPNTPSKVYAYGYFVNSGRTDSSTWATSSDSGKTWSLPPAGEHFIDDPPSTIVTFASLGNSSQLYAGFASDGLWRGETYGTSWAQISSIGDATVTALAVNAINVPRVLYLGTTSGLYWSGNADTTSYSDVSLTLRIASPYPKKIVIDPRYADSTDISKDIFWIGSDNNVYRSVNSGIDTAGVTGTGFPAGTIFNDLRTDPSDPSKLYVATSSGVYYAQLAVPPVSPSPANGATGVSICSLVLSWGAVTGATSYHLQFGTDATFGTNLVDVNQSGTSYSYGSSLVCNQLYYWRVNSTNTGFGTSKWSKFSFTAGCPQATLVNPNDQSTLEWCQANGFDFTASGSYGFRFQADTTTNFNSINKIEDSTISGTTFHYQIDSGHVKCAHTYYWRVQSKTCDGSWGLYSSTTRQFTTTSCLPTITLAWPSNALSGIGACPAPIIRWSYTSCADSVWVEVDSVSGFTSNPLLDNIVKGVSTSATLSNNLSNSKTYYWRAAGKKGSSWGSWSTTFSFTTGNGSAPSAPTQVSPSNGCTNCSGPLVWRFVTNAARYHYDVSASSNFSPIADSATVGDTAWSPAGLSGGVKYWWHVNASNCGNTSAFSSTWTFTTPGGFGPPIAVATGQERHRLPTEFTLMQNYPNPFNPTTRFEYALPENSFVKLRIVDVLGHEVATLVDGYQEAGYKSIDFNADKFSSGIYFYMLTTPKYWSVKKMILLK